MSPARAVVTVGGIGDMPIAPGTWAALATIPFCWLLHWLGGFPLVMAATAMVIIGGYWAATVYLAGRPEDPSEIVIDEVAGMLIALWPLSLGLDVIGAEREVFPWPGWVLGFLLFRFFDIVKPPPISWADRIKTPLGVMLDDVLAGVIAAIVATLAAGVSHGWFA